MKLIRLGPPEFVTLARGADPVAEPLLEGQCWALVPPRSTGLLRHHRCDWAAVKGRLCCPKHLRVDGRERQAQKLKARLESIRAAAERFKARAS